MGSFVFYCNKEFCKHLFVGNIKRYETIQIFRFIQFKNMDLEKKDFNLHLAAF